MCASGRALASAIGVDVADAAGGSLSASVGATGGATTGAGGGATTGAGGGATTGSGVRTGAAGDACAGRGATATGAGATIGACGGGACGGGACGAGACGGGACPGGGATGTGGGATIGACGAGATRGGGGGAGGGSAPVEPPPTPNSSVRCGSAWRLCRSRAAGDEGVERGGELDHRREARGRRRVERAREPVVQGRVEAATKLGGARRGRTERLGELVPQRDRVERLHAQDAERQVARERMERDHAGRVHVHPRRARARRGGRLGRDPARRGGPAGWRRRGGAQPGDTEVGDARARGIVGIDEHVGRLEAAVDEAGGVRRFERRRHRGEQRRRSRGRHGRAGDDRRQRRPRDAFADGVRSAEHGFDGALVDLRDRVEG